MSSRGVGGFLRGRHGARMVQARREKEAAMRAGFLVLGVAAVVIGSAGCTVVLPPRITGIDPQEAAVSTVVGIIGRGFGEVEGTVTFDGLPAEVLLWTPTRITVRVPVIATPGGKDEAVPVVVSTVRSTVGPFSFTVVRGILIASDREGDFDVYTMNPDGSRPENLTGHPAMDGRPAWSPDGTEIAFFSDRTNGGDIYVMDADGTHLRQLTDDPAWDGAPAWSPDGARIAFHTARGGWFAVYLMDADGSDEVLLATSIGGATGPSWSPTGDEIVYHAVGQGANDLLVVDVNLRAARDITPDTFTSIEEAAVWSPDGSKIAFQTNRDGNYEVYVMDADGTAPVDLTRSPADDGFPTWSPDGTRIAFQSDREGDYEVYSMDANGGNVVQLTDRHSAEDGQPAWGD